MVLSKKRGKGNESRKGKKVTNQSQMGHEEVRPEPDAFVTLDYALTSCDEVIRNSSRSAIISSVATTKLRNLGLTRKYFEVERIGRNG